MSPGDSQRKLKIGILNAYQFDPDPNGYQARYTELFRDFFQQRLERIAEVKIFNVALGSWPENVSDYDGYIISGSSKSAYESDPWILKLIDFIRAAHAQHRKLVGICFGHQLIAHSLGGKVEKSVRGWGVGVQEFAVKSEASWMRPQISTDKLSLIFSHQDQVIELPPGAVLLAQNDFCPHQMFTLDSHVFCMQGHPEFTPEFAQDRLNARRNLLGAELYKNASKSLTNPTDHELLAQWIERFLETE